MGKINVLPFAVANLIAAGEVVDRPASVIKELMENAIDAGADRITVEIQNGGVTFMRVTDNGCGMSPEDLPVAIRRHATSKIKVAEDLDGILTLGFRGEALAAIASVSDVRIISKTADAQYGVRLFYFFRQNDIKTYIFLLHIPRYAYGISWRKNDKPFGLNFENRIVYSVICYLYSLL